MKRFIAALLGFLFICNILYISPASAEEITTKRQLTMEEAVDYANQEIGGPYYETPYDIKINGTYQTKELNRKIWDDRQILVYGQPTDICDPVKDIDKTKAPTDKGYFRYLGYTANGDLMPDPEFREDHASTTLINNYLWVVAPWERGLATDNNGFDGLEQNDQYIKAGLLEKYKDNLQPPAKVLYDNSLEPKTNPNGVRVPWHTVTKILQPRTNYTPGLGRAWHFWNNSYWYITVFIPVELPKETDIEVVNLQNETPVPTSTDQVAGVTLRNNGNETTEFEVQYYVGATQINKETLTLDPGETLETGYEWTSPATIQNVVLQALTVPVTGETKIENNEKTFTVQMANSVKPPCANVRTVTGDWNVTYSWPEIRHRTVWHTDSAGKRTSSRESYTVIVSKKAGYSESLTADITVNTHQGITNGGRESRGAWEIIPWAKQNRLDPNEVTRSGYGFEVKLVTTYSNDWETKVPIRSSPKGGSFKGPDKVVAEFYDTKGRFVKRVNLLPTKGKAGDKNITWELPSERYTFQDGQTIYERKHYTDISVPDGKYQVKVTVSGAGKNELCLIQKKYVTIYKDAYEDIYTRVAREDE